MRARVCNFGVDRKLITENPVRTAKLLREPNVRKTVVPVPAIDQVTALLKDVRGDIALADAKVPESVVMRMSGHRTHDVFRRYNIVEDEDLQDAVSTIEAHQKAVVDGTIPSKFEKGGEPKK